MTARTTLRDPLARGALATAAFLAVVWLSLFNRADPDLWGHVRYGQDLLASGHLSRTATHTFTAAGHPWVNHEVFAEVAFALVADGGGRAGLIVLKAALGIALVSLLVARALARGAGVASTAMSVVLVAVNVAPGWSWRPQLFGFSLYLLVLLCLDGRRRRWLLPPLVAVWTNTHGSFVAGVGVIGAWLGAEAVEALAQQRVRGLRTACARVRLFGLTVLATLFNPYGATLLRWLALDLAPPRPEIAEWRSLSPGDPHFLPFVLLALVVAIAWLANRDARRLPWTVVLAVTAWQSVLHVRHVPFFALVAGVWLPTAMEGALGRWRSARVAVHPRRPLGWFIGGVWPVTLALAACTVAGRRGLEVDRARYPVDAFRFMAAHGLTGRLVANFDWAQYAIAAFAPATTVAFDGRLRTSYPQELADFYFDFLIGDRPGHRWRDPRSEPFDDERILSIGHPELVLVSRRFRHSVSVMERQNDWVLLYQDALAQLWGRRDRYDDPASPAHVPRATRRITEATVAGDVPWPAFPPAPPAMDG